MVIGAAEEYERQNSDGPELTDEERYQRFYDHAGDALTQHLQDELYKPLYQFREGYRAAQRSCDFARMDQMSSAIGLLILDRMDAYFEVIFDD